MEQLISRLVKSGNIFNYFDPTIGKSRVIKIGQYQDVQDPKVIQVCLEYILKKKYRDESREVISQQMEKFKGDISKDQHQSNLSKERSCLAEKEFSQY